MKTLITIILSVVALVGVAGRNLLSVQFMKTNLNLLQTRIFCAVALGIGSFLGLAAAAEHSADAAPVTTAIPWSQLGAKAGADYQGDALAVIPTAEGARLRCAFQRLEGEATREGLWLTSTVIPPGGTVNDRFRLVAAEVGRVTLCAPSATGGVTDRSANLQPSTSGIELSATGTVSIDGQSVRFTRPGLVEEYTASMDGVRQDFVVLERPPDLGELVLRVAVSGARVEPAAFGAQVVLANSGRKIAYNRLKVTDANGRELPARMEVATAPESKIGNQKSEILRVVVDDAEAVYPVRIDPTFSDANWSSMGGFAGADGLVSAAVVDGSGNLYIGGNFNVAGDVIANRVAKWDGSSWSALGSGISGGIGEGYAQVSALAVSGSDLYAGGSFTTAGGSAATNIAKWNGSSWSALGSGIGGGNYDHAGVSALAVSGSNLYVGGAFTTAGGIAAKSIAKWDGSSWSALGSGLGGSFPYVEALAVSGDDVYVGGSFAIAGGSFAYSVAKWNGSSWLALGSGMNSELKALAVSGSNLYAAGEFSTAGGSPASHIARWNGSSWSALGSGMVHVFCDCSLGVSALAVSGSDLYVGGSFTIAGGSMANSIARWNGSSWSALGSGIGGFPYAKVSALAVSGSDVYAGGEFTSAGGIGANHIAKWDGSSWSALGSGLSGGDYPHVSALAVSGSNLYAGGGFTTAGDSAANYIAKWNGSSWSALGSGMDGSVIALSVSGSYLYAGGYFTTAGGIAANGIAKWDGSSWSALGSGMIDGGVLALAVAGTDVYAGGYFATAGGHAANSIAKWDGSSWTALGSGVDGSVSALAVSGSNLYAGGYFTTADWSPANYIAKWNGSNWSALGSGMNGTVSALAVSGSDLYAGGWFTTAGGKVSAYIARAYRPALPTLSVLRSSENVTISWPTVDTAGFALEQAGPLAAPAGWVPNSATVTNDGTNKSVTLPATNTSQFFRLRRP